MNFYTIYSLVFVVSYIQDTDLSEDFGAHLTVRDQTCSMERSIEIDVLIHKDGWGTTR